MIANLRAKLGEVEFQTSWDQGTALDTEGLLDRIQKGDLDGIPDQDDHPSSVQQITAELEEISFQKAG